MGKFGKRRTGPWYSEDRARLVFEARATEYFPSLRRQAARVPGHGLSYAVEIDVPCYDRRRVDISFAASRSAGHPVILADGPTDSPHRYPSFDRRRLCIWYPDDPEELRWVQRDGLLTLLGLTKLHLFREAWWRETGEWPGPQAPHSVDQKTVDD
jgi:hypothetical protein